MVNIIPAKQQHVSIVIVSILAFISKHHCAYEQHQKAVSMAVDYVAWKKHCNFVPI